MHTYLRAAAIGVTTVAALLTMSSESPAAERVVIRIYNTYGAGASQLADATTTAAGILRDAHVRAVWRDCSSGCAEALGPGDLLVRIVAAPEGAAAGSLGCAVVNLQAGRGTLATVYADRIAVLAGRTGVEAATLLGRALAHEIGHLLLGTARHSAAGLMRAVWSDRELQRNAASDWTWSPADMSRLGRGLLVREESGRFVPFCDTEDEQLCR
jgi:hypothetical protein